MQTIVYDSARTVPNLEYGIYYIDPEACDALHPKDDNKYGNALSMVFYFRHGSHTILFPGDMTPEGMAHILANDLQKSSETLFVLREGIRAETSGVARRDWKPTHAEGASGRGLTVLVAPHHGLESCYSKELFATMWGGKPSLNVLSERRKAHDGDGTKRLTHLAGLRRSAACTTD